MDLEKIKNTKTLDIFFKGSLSENDYEVRDKDSENNLTKQPTRCHRKKLRLGKLEKSPLMNFKPPANPEDSKESI